MVSSPEAARVSAPALRDALAYGDGFELSRLLEGAARVFDLEGVSAR